MNIYRTVENGGGLLLFGVINLNTLKKKNNAPRLDVLCLLKVHSHA